MTCNECLDKEICARLNGYFQAPKNLIVYNFKICVTYPKVLNEMKKQMEQKNDNRRND